MGRYIKSQWVKIAKKNDIDISISGIDALPNFTFKNSHNYLKTYLTDEMLKKKYLCTTNIFVSTAHTKKIIDKYLNNLDIIFSKISKNKRNIKKLYNGKIAVSTFDRLN